MFKSCNVVALKTNSEGAVSKSSKDLVEIGSASNPSWNNYHLFVYGKELSTIDGEWCIKEYYGLVGGLKQELVKFRKTNKRDFTKYRRIVATTNPNLGLALIPYKFIELYVQFWNEKDPITKVSVVYNDNPNSQEVLFSESQQEYFYEDLDENDNFITVWLGKYKDGLKVNKDNVIYIFGHKYELV